MRICLEGSNFTLVLAMGEVRFVNQRTLANTSHRTTSLLDLVSSLAYALKLLIYTGTPEKSVLRM